jgi:hypothetical protein
LAPDAGNHFLSATQAFTAGKRCDFRLGRRESPSQWPSCDISVRHFATADGPIRNGVETDSGKTRTPCRLAAPADCAGSPGSERKRWFACATADCSLPRETPSVCDGPKAHM